jgi:hypothetical protein
MESMLAQLWDSTLHPLRQCFHHVKPLPEHLPKLAVIRVPDLDEQLRALRFQQFRQNPELVPVQTYHFLRSYIHNESSSAIFGFQQYTAGLRESSAISFCRLFKSLCLCDEDPAPAMAQNPTFSAT